MPNANYIRGANFERKIKKEYEQNGYYVMRSSGSKGIADLIAIKIHQPNLSGQKPEPWVVLIQCGEDIKEKKDKLKTLAEITGCRHYYAVIPPKRKSTGKTKKKRESLIRFKTRQYKQRKKLNKNPKYKDDE